jgi:hypothetical protein
MVALLKSGSIDWKDNASVALVSEAFRLGAVAGILKLSREEAKDVLALKGFVAKAKSTVGRRTQVQQAAYRAAISRWSYAAQAAGMPHQTTGATRPPKHTESDSPAPITLAAVIVPKASTFEDVKTFARNIAALIRRFENANAKVARTEYHIAFDTFISTVNAIGKAEASVASLKPAKETAPVAMVDAA